jgi:hypothetical protein
VKHLFLGGPLHGTLVDVPPDVTRYMYPIVPPPSVVEYMPTLQHIDIQYERTRYQKAATGEAIDVFIAELAYAEYGEVEKLIREHNL